MANNTNFTVEASHRMPSYPYMQISWMFCHSTHGMSSQDSKIGEEKKK